VRIEVDLEDLEAITEHLADALREVLDAATASTDDELTGSERHLFAALRAIRLGQEGVEDAIAREARP
jgi:hypothetical protein